MPTSLHEDFFGNNYRRIPGGLYVISSAESRVYRPQKGYKKAYKLGSSWDLGKRINNYLLSYPWSHPAGLEIECVLMMSHATTKAEKAHIQQCEKFVHRQLHKIYQETSHYPGFENGQRLNKDRIEWYQDVPIRVIANVIKYAQKYYGGCFCEGGSYAEAWRVYKKKKIVAHPKSPPDYLTIEKIILK